MMVKAVYNLRWIDFSKLWTALSISLVGSQITALALPLFAARSLGASALQMGVLAGAAEAPFLLFSLPAGAFVDRLPRRPVLIATDLASAVLLLSIPLATLFGGPTYLQLCLVAFGIGTFTVLSEVAHYAYVPMLVGRRELTRFNSRLQVSHSAANAGGPGLAGVLIQLLTAPMAVLADAVSFLCSAVLLRAIRKPEPPVEAEAEEAGLLRAVREGLRWLLGHRLLRPLIVILVPAVFCESGVLALYILYATRNLDLSPLLIGIIFAAGGLGAIPGAIVAERSGARFGVGPAIIGGYVLSGLAALVVPIAAGPTAVIVAILVVAKAFGGITDTTANVQQWTLRQTATPDRLQGRVTAGHRFSVYGAGAIGAIAAGGLGSLVGVRAALLVFAAGMVVAPLLGLFTPIRSVREQAAEVDEESPDAEPAIAPEADALTPTCRDDPPGGDDGRRPREEAGVPAAPSNGPCGARRRSPRLSRR
jgi:MFS family permease